MGVSYALRDEEPMGNKMMDKSKKLKVDEGTMLRFAEQTYREYREELEQAERRGREEEAEAILKIIRKLSKDLYRSEGLKIAVMRLEKRMKIR